jgi:hypothetical protein
MLTPKITNQRMEQKKMKNIQRKKATRMKARNFLLVWYKYKQWRNVRGHQGFAWVDSAIAFQSFLLHERLQKSLGSSKISPGLDICLFFGCAKESFVDDIRLFILWEWGRAECSSLIDALFSELVKIYFFLIKTLPLIFRQRRGKRMGRKWWSWGGGVRRPTDNSFV